MGDCGVCSFASHWCRAGSAAEEYLFSLDRVSPSILEALLWVLAWPMCFTPAAPTLTNQL